MINVLLFVLAGLLSIITALGVYIFRGVVADIREIKDEFRRDRERQSKYRAQLIVTLVALQTELNPEARTKIVSAFDRLINGA